MTRDLWARPPKVEPVRWKPTKCADCPARHPSHSRDGPDGPWRCAKCDAVAQPKPKPRETVEPLPGAPPTQRTLL